MCSKDTYGLGGLIINSGGDWEIRNCTSCPKNQMTLYTGAKSAAECVCKPG